MTGFLLVVIFLASALSLVSYIYCWHDIRGGRPHILSLRQITGIMDRNRINRLVGPPQPGYYYPLAPEALYGLIRNRRWFYVRECAADSLCAFGAWLAMTGRMGEWAVLGFIALAGLCQSINFAYAIHLIGKWREQILEELDYSDD